jgi:hypothetical protein
VDVDVTGVHQLTLRVIPAVLPNTARDDAVPADWVDAQISTHGKS